MSNLHDTSYLHEVVMIVNPEYVIMVMRVTSAKDVPYWDAYHRKEEYGQWATLIRSSMEMGVSSTTYQNTADHNNFKCCRDDVEHHR